MKEFEHAIPAVLNKPAMLPSDLISQRIIELEKALHTRIDALEEHAKNCNYRVEKLDICDNILRLDDKIDKLETRIKELESKDIDTKQWVR
jgi:BMFP domain-containing protein YqiC